MEEIESFGGQERAWSEREGRRAGRAGRGGERTKSRRIYRAGRPRATGAPQTVRHRPKSLSPIPYLDGMNAIDTLHLFLVALTFGHFTSAVDIDTDIEGNIYVVDRRGNAVVMFSPAGDSLRAISGIGREPLQFDEPTSVVARSGNEVLVADRNNDRVQRFTRRLEYVGTIRTRDDPDERNRFGRPRDIAVTRQGDVLIVDGENRRIVRVDPLGRPRGSFGDIGGGLARLVDPEQIELDEGDNILVLDRGRVVRFDPFGAPLGAVPLPDGFQPRSMAAAGTTLVVSDSTTALLIDLAAGGGREQLPLPTLPVALRPTPDGRWLLLSARTANVLRRQ